MYEDKLYLTFCPKTKVLTANSNHTTPFSEKIKYGRWSDILKDGEIYFMVQIIKEDEDDFVFNVKGLEKDEQPENYDIYDILNNQDLRIVDENGVTTGSVISI